MLARNGRRESRPVQVQSQLSKRTTLRILLAMAVLGVGVAIFGVVEWQRAKASERWPTVEGVVVSTEIKWHRRSGSDQRSRRTSYMPVVTYRYDVSGDVYENDRMAFAQPSSSTERSARRVLGRYPVGGGVTVHYHPRKPGLSVLEPGVAVGVYFIMLFGVVWTVGWLGFWRLFSAYMPGDEAGAETGR